MTNEKKDLLTDIFWNMHTINYGSELQIETVYWESVDENGELITEENEVEYNYLLIRVDHKTASEMAEHYGFTWVFTYFDMGIIPCYLRRICL